MTRQSTILFLSILSLHLVLSSSIRKRQAPELSELDPIQQALQSHPVAVEHDGRGDRDKRLGVIKSIGVKALLLNFIFGKIDGFIDHKTRIVNQLDKQNVIKNEKYFGITPPPKGPSKPRPQSSITTTTTDSTYVFSTSSPVSLVIPDRLYGNSFSLVTNISETIGDVLFNTADRAQEFSSRLSNIARRQFGFATNLLGGNRSKAPSKSSASSSSSSSTKFQLL